MWSRRCSFPEAISARLRCTAPSTTSPWPVPYRFICLRASLSRKAFGFQTSRQSRTRWARRRNPCGVHIITGDTKVVEHGKADGLFISTAGVGLVPEGFDLSAENARVGDRVLISGTLGDHGVAIMSKRQNLAFETEIVSDSVALHDLVARMVAAGGCGIRLMRDPTRGGLAATLNEIAQQSELGFSLQQEAIPVKPGVAAACELLGLDPLNVANEGSCSRSSRLISPEPCWPP